MKKNLLILIAILIIAIVVFYLFNKQEKQQDGLRVREVVEGFGKSLKSVPLLAPKEIAAQSIEENYRNFIAPELLSEWIIDPSKAVGRLTSSPWPERIEILSVRQFGSGAYDVTGNVIELTSVEEVEGGIAAKRPVEMGVVKFGGKWLIVSVNLGEYSSLEEGLVGWGSIERLVADCQIEKAWQYHSGRVTVLLKNGNELESRQPKLDRVIALIDSAEEKCGKVLVGTE